MKKVWNVITTVLLVLMIAVAAVIYVPKLLGVEPMIVLSGSMEPTYHVGSLLYVKDVDPETIEVGDAITFQLGDSVVTHRVIEINDTDRTFTTQGDANNVADGAPVGFDQVIGRPVFNIPLLGYLANKLSSTTGKIIYITAIVVVLILMYMGDVIWSPEGKKNEES